MQQEREEKIRKGTSPSSESKVTSRTDEKRLELIEAIIKPGKLFLFNDFGPMNKVFLRFLVEKSISGGSYDNGDPCTTNIYLGNINPKVRHVHSSYANMIS